MSGKSTPRIAFASTHCLLDHTSGVANGAADTLRFLAAIGFPCHAFCGSHFDAQAEASVEELLARRQCPFEIEPIAAGSQPARVVSTVLPGEVNPADRLQNASCDKGDGRENARCGKAADGNSTPQQVPLIVFCTQSSQGQWAGSDESGAFLGRYADFLDRVNPDVLITYGDDAVSRAMIGIARARGTVVVFFLHDRVYRNPATFAAIDYALAPSEFARQFYRETIGLDCHVLPLVFDPARAEATEDVHGSGEGRPEACPANSTANTDPPYVPSDHPEPRMETYGSPESLAPLYRDFFSSLSSQSSPPLVPITQVPAAKFVTCTMLGRAGRLGNQLFQIAVTIGTARRNEMAFVFPPWAYADHFQRPIPQSHRIPTVERYVEPSFAYNDVKLSASADLVGCFQSERYFQDCEEEIRSYLTPQPQLMQYLKVRFGELLDGNKTCSIHVRRGRYVGNPHYTDLAATDYYEKAIRCFDADTVFLIFSDDILWCRGRFCDSRIVFVSEQTNIADLFLMSLCRGHIIANSSFSWWGAWLDPRKDKTVVAPAQWFAGDYTDPSLPFHAMPYAGYHDASDIIPAGWIRL